MDFLKSVYPCVDWKNLKVSCFAGRRRFDLPTCPIDDMNSADHNSFVGLHVDFDDSEQESSNEMKNVAEQVHVATDKSCLKHVSGAGNCPEKCGKSEKRCVQCGKVFVGTDSYC